MNRARRLALRVLLVTRGQCFDHSIVRSDSKCSRLPEAVAAFLRQTQGVPASVGTDSRQTTVSYKPGQSFNHHRCRESLSIDRPGRFSGGPDAP